MHRFYLPPQQCRGAELELREDQAHHAQHVLRARIGDRVSVLDGAGRELLSEITRLGRDQVGLRVVQVHELPSPSWQITVFQAVTKARSMDFVMQKATELGAHRIVPVLSDRSVPQLAGEHATRKVDRWRDLAIEALKQCGTPWLPRIEEPVPVTSALAAPERAELTLVGSLQPGRRHPREYLDSYRREHGRNPRTVSIWIGPEGDFTPAELHGIQASGALPISLGPLVLRAETATLYCLAILSYELQP